MKYILCGSGVEAEYFLYSNLEVYKQILICIDRNTSKIFHNIPIITMEDALSIIMLREYKIIVAAEDYSIFKSIAAYLEAHELVEWSDFIWSKCFGKEIVCINANCYGTALKTFLNASKTFSKKYFIYPMDEIHLNENKKIPENLLEHLDIYIHQDIKANNSIGYKLSDEYTLSNLKKSAKDICIPNIVGMGRWLYPNIKNLDKVIQGSNGEITYVLFRDEVLDEATRTCRNLAEYRDFWNNYTYDNDVLSDYYQKIMDKIISREKTWDMKISDYIISNYKTIPMLVDVGHPSKYLMKMICDEVANIIGINDVSYLDLNIPLGIPTPILPYVKKYFKLNYQYQTEKCTFRFGKEVVDEIDDYIRFYIWWYHNIILE